jgi:ketosteroid isomerase-like protein
LSKRRRLRNIAAMKILRVCEFAVLACMTSVVFASDIPADLAKAVRDYDHAQIHGDRTELQRLVADDYTLLNSSGRIENKAKLIADYTAPGFKLEPFTVREPIEKAWRDGAVMGGIATIRGVDAGKPFEVTLRFTDVWAKRNGVWQVVYTHVSRPPEA